MLLLPTGYNTLSEALHYSITKKNGFDRIEWHGFEADCRKAQMGWRGTKIEKRYTLIIRGPCAQAPLVTRAKLLRISQERLPTFLLRHDSYCYCLYLVRFVFGVRLCAPIEIKTNAGGGPAGGRSWAHLGVTGEE